MKQVAEALRNAGKYVLTDHAKDRIRQRVGNLTEDAAIAWVTEKVKSASTTKNGHNGCVRYISESYEIILDGVKVVTVKPSDSSNRYLTKFSDMIEKESTKLLKQYLRAFRKAEIEIAEAHLNYLKAKNPNTKALIIERMTEATDRKATLEDEIKKVRKAASSYGVKI